jgi:hypothetical protein
VNPTLGHRPGPTPDTGQAPLGTPACLVAAPCVRHDTLDKMQPRFSTLCDKLGTEPDSHRRQVDLVRASLLARPVKTVRPAPHRAR